MLIHTGTIVPDTLYKQSMAV